MHDAIAVAVLRLEKIDPRAVELLASILVERSDDLAGHGANNALKPFRTAFAHGSRCERLDG